MLIELRNLIDFIVFFGLPYKVCTTEAQFVSIFGYRAGDNESGTLQGVMFGNGNLGDPVY